MLTALAAVAVVQTVGTAVDYFPIVPGNEWEYQDTDNGTQSRVRDIVLKPEQLGDELYFPVESTIQGRQPERVYYRVLAGQIDVMGFDPDHLLPEPYPIFKLPRPGQLLTWKTTAETAILDQRGPIVMTGSARWIPRYSYAGKLLPAVEVTIHSEFAVSLSDGKKVTSDQISLYVKGFGQVRYRDTGQLGKQRFARIRKLISFKPSLVPTR